MNTEFQFSARAAKRLFLLVLAAFLVVASAPFFQPGHAAAAQVSERSIKMSDASPSGVATIPSGVGSGNGVTYELSFIPSAGATESLIIDFCAEDPILNDTCTGPTGMVVPGTPTISSVAGTLCGTGWSATATASHIVLTNDGNAAHDLSNVTQTCDIAGITNPSTIGTFYARMYTWSGTTQTGYASATNIGTAYKDYGAMALTTTPTITITARVQETLSFCMTNIDNTSTPWSLNDCTSPEISAASAAPNLTLGHNAAGGSTAILDPTQTDTAAVYTQLSTNATHGAIIRMRNSNLTCGGLSADNGATCAIPAVGGTTPAAITPGTAAFGVFVSAGAAALNGTGTLTPDPNYNDGTHNSTGNFWFGMDNGVGGVTSTYGDPIASAPGPIYRMNQHYIFAATAALTTPAGIYTANISVICTGTF